jgi:hypothetical protein
VDDHIVAASPRAAAAFSRPTIFGAEVTLAPKRRQAAQVLVSFENHVAAAAAVAAVWTSTRHILLPAEVDHAITAAARGDLNFDLV